MCVFRVCVVQLARRAGGVAAIPAIIPPVERAWKRSTANSRSICASVAGVGRFEMERRLDSAGDAMELMRCEAR